MSTVVSRIKEIKQPRGGYLPLKMFYEHDFGGETILNDQETISPILIGLVVDYLTRFMLSKDPEKSFNISIRGAKAKDYWTDSGNLWLKKAQNYLKKIKELDDESITSAINLSKFDDWYRNPNYAKTTNNNTRIDISIETIENIRNLVNRGLAFFEEYGPINKYEFNFNPPDYKATFNDFLIKLSSKSFGGYTQTVTNGDGDYLTNDTIWDIKVSKSKPTSAHTLQILMYWVMGQHSGQEMFKDITKIGIFNPRLNIAYQLEVSKITKETIEAVEKNVICY